MRPYSVAARALMFSEMRARSAWPDTSRKKNSECARNRPIHLLTMKILRQLSFRVRKNAAPLKLA